MRNAKIVCTLGPASDDRDTIRGLAEAGMSVARLNASHGTTSHREDVIARVREVDDAIDDPLAVMVDLKGPEIRTAEIDEPIRLETGSEVTFRAGSDATPQTVGLTHSIAAAGPGDIVLLDDGRIECRVERVTDDGVVATVISGGKLSSRKGVNLPGVDVDVDLITPADEDELRLAARAGADFVAASFVRDANDVYRIADSLETYGGEDIPVIAKIERAGAVENLDGIVAAADGVMVARGDLGVECPLEEVPMVQKRIIRKCLNAGVPVITATEMLDSMVHSRRPTRAEASDVANAVLDGTDAVMLSGETAIGDHPVSVVETMDRIVREVESSEEYAETREQRVPVADADSRTEALARSARYLARDIGASAVVAVSESGYTARKTAMFRPGVPVVTTTPNDRVRRQLALSWGVTPVTTAYARDMEAVLDNAVEAALDAGAADSGDTLVVLSGMMTELEGTNTTNTLKVHVAAETLVTGKGAVTGRVAAPIHRTVDGDLSAVPDGSVVALGPDFDDEFSGDLDRIAGIIDARPGMTGYPAVVARELGVPMVSGAVLPESVADGTVVTVDGERGIVYDGDVTNADRR
ncbi:pyruvate kinase [Halorubrum sp. JWXQ-INN 858]|uniref:pyruvate kinase n=1 Tax=Halorubrum sp. JWXQ-INN 858 TaxID=2690782 RepID=UPI00135CDE35|nr:pyruvate kinase [Halorubrum sp. JWXQ-INN 858]MWV65828.1 pyruvate kinase [Halorubrum sp. JWXQ-INN 858]